jgi:hypothetical protein
VLDGLSADELNEALGKPKGFKSDKTALSEAGLISMIGSHCSIQKKSAFPFG